MGIVTEKILNCTVHNLTEAQTKDGGIEPSTEVKNKIKEILTIVNIPDEKELKQRAIRFAQVVDNYRNDNFKIGVMPSVLIGSGTPSIQPYIVQELRELGIDFVYSHSERECVETHLPDGTVEKKYVFAHKGWY